MRPFVVVEAEVAVETAQRVSDRLVVVEINLLPFDRAPEAFDEDVVQRPPAPIPTDLDACLLQPSGVGGAGKLDTLIGVEDARLTIAQRALQRFQAEAGIERVREFPRQHIATVPVKDGHQVEKAVLQRI